MPSGWPVLRHLTGAPRSTIDSPDRPGDNQALRYRIPKGQYDLPDEVRFTPDERALLGLAAEVWREASLSAANVQLVCPECSAPARVGRKRLDDGRSVRYCRKCNGVVDK